MPYIPSLGHGPNVGNKPYAPPQGIYDGKYFKALLVLYVVLEWALPYVTEGKSPLAPYTYTLSLTRLLQFIGVKYFSKAALTLTLTAAQAPLYVAGLILFQWSRVWGWTHSLYPRFMQSDVIAENGFWGDLRTVVTDNSEWLEVHDSSYEFYLTHRIPLFEFIAGYRKGALAVKGDLQDALRAYEEWAFCGMNWPYLHFLFTVYIPDTMIHSRDQDVHQVTEHYNLGNDFFGWFLGQRMVYTCGYFYTGDETLEEAQDNKMSMVAAKLDIQPGMRVLDLGCGWGTWAMYLAKEHGAETYGLSISDEQVAFAKKRVEKNRIKGCNWLLRDYRDMPRANFDRITCFEMAEHVGIKRFRAFLRTVYESLADDGLFYLQIAGLRECWQHEDVSWGLFMYKYIFRGADASLPLNWVTSQLECENFEVHSVETIGVHYAQTIQCWYKNWLQNKDKIIKAYDAKTYRTYEIFLGWSSIIPEKGSSTCFQIVCHKNLDDFDRYSFYGEGKRIHHDFVPFKNFK